jgi:DNA (cytosine-5)-methyltransferase 1
MENVPQVHSQDNLEDFNKWKLRLEELGYKNYFQDLIATDYGIPQTRNRCFMISILGEYNYVFPQPIPLKLKLKDMLEDNVDEKYYLSDKMIDFFTHNAEKQKAKGNGFAFNATSGDTIAKTVTTRAGSRMDDNYIIGKIENWYQRGNVYDAEYSSPTICATDYKTPKLIKIKNATKQGYLEATDGDGIDISSRMEHHRGTVQKGKTQTLTTMGGENNGVVLNDLRIRKLTPRECFRLMGVKDEDFEKCAKNQSDSSLYHLAGDSIVVNVLMAIFNELLKKEGE